jgi:hypothetical protein
MQRVFHLITLCSWKESYEYNSKANQPSLRSIACMNKRKKVNLIAVVNACKLGIPLLNTLSNAVVSQFPVVSYGHTRDVDAIQIAALRL